MAVCSSTAVDGFSTRSLATVVAGPAGGYGTCAVAWPVYFAQGTPRAGAGVKQALIGTTRRRDGRRPLTYNGWPLYYYAHEGPGEVECQNVDQFGGLWLVVRRNGTLVR